MPRSPLRSPLGSSLLSRPACSPGSAALLLAVSLIAACSTSADGASSDDIREKDTEGSIQDAFDPIGALGLAGKPLDQAGCAKLAKFYSKDVMRVFVGGYLVLPPNDPYTGCVFYPKHAHAGTGDTYPMVFIPKDAVAKGTSHYTFQGSSQAHWQSYRTGAYRYPTAEEVSKAPFLKDFEVDMLYLADIVLLTEFKSGDSSAPKYLGAAPTGASLDAYKPVLAEMGAARGVNEALFVATEQELRGVIGAIQTAATLTGRKAVVTVTGFASNTSEASQTALAEARTKTMVAAVKKIAGPSLAVVEGVGKTIPADRKVELNSREAQMRQATRISFELRK